MDTYQIEGEEVVEREVKATGNGAHVFIPKDWLGDTVKTVRQPEETELELENCDVCQQVTADCESWCWTDEGGGAYFQICARCRAEVEEQPDEVCAICRQDRERKKSDGFGARGPNAEFFTGCDSCRSRVVFEDPTSADPAWVE